MSSNSSRCTCHFQCSRIGCLLSNGFVESRRFSIGFSKYFPLHVTVTKCPFGVLQRRSGKYLVASNIDFSSSGLTNMHWTLYRRRYHKYLQSSARLLGHWTGSTIFMPSYDKCLNFHRKPRERQLNQFFEDFSWVKFRKSQQLNSVSSLSTRVYNSYLLFLCWF